MNYYNYKYYITNAMNLLNGQINKNLRCHTFSFIYSTDEVYARESNGSITFNLQSIAYALRNKDMQTIFAYLLKTVAHELSHIEQDVNYFKYETDYSYRAWIEKSNELNCVCFVMENLNMIRTNLGDFNQEIFKDLYYYAKSHGTNYVAASKSKMVSNIMESHMIDTKRALYKDLDTIIMNVNGSRYIIKSKGNVIDPNILYPVIHELHFFKTFKVFNMLNGSTLMIKVEAKDENRKLEDIVFRIDKKYII